MVEKEKEKYRVDAFAICDPSHYDLVEIISGHDELFHNPKGLPPKREIEHEIHLQ